MLLSHSGGSFLAGKAAWAPSGCLPTEIADYCMLINEWAWLRSRVCLLRLIDSVLESELRQKMKIWCITDMCMLLVASSETNLSVKW